METLKSEKMENLGRNLCAEGVGPETGSVPRHRDAPPKMGARGSCRVLENGQSRDLRGR